VRGLKNTKKYLLTGEEWHLVGKEKRVKKFRGGKYLEGGRHRGVGDHRKFANVKKKKSGGITKRERRKNRMKRRILKKQTGQRMRRTKLEK